MPVITEIEDLRRLHRRRVPRMFYDYVDVGAWTGSTYRANRADFERILLRQRVARNIEARSLATTMLGQPVSMPLALAPVGLLGMQHPDGEILAARAAHSAGVPFTLSTMSMCSLEDVAAATGAPFWFQLYTLRDEEFLDNILDRARRAGVTALVLTLDLTIQGQRHKDLKNRMTAPPRLTLPNLIDIALHPRWALGMLGTRRRSFGNIVGHARGVDSLGDLMDWTARQFDQRLDWARVEQIIRKWGGPVILKGINDPEDARRALDTGCDAILVSNHGGRQLDGAPSTIRTLPAIRRAVGPELPLYLDSGVQSGQEALKAIARGANGVFVGRAFTYGLGAMGQKGVETALAILRREMDITMALCGVNDIKDFGPGCLWPDDRGNAA
ncbi:alpha-hydroxy acid oxidase [Paracoccus pantotrophus]|uniref:alpha-hydroxy acid oxidase n=1 Tax=Paracoccus pantotrophus TaxID=82367 RepID=UPI0008E183A4|nr:alpha-hydroxy acid oxidase [Paracoccus pantotrophus]MDF3853816.1 alpha-hydroxy acid oxidase [Paracoccus pantotrophus]RNI15226.1 alpha-hydroxy-acid oxidizing protein [Paracoccus pantotrophus]SFO50920.1 L-lactate dehydrogenase (cytochrome) [Paracoccus pantotrophus]